MTQPTILSPRHSGVYCSPADTASLARGVSDGGGRWLEADLGAVRTKRALLEALAQAASFSPDFGYNWDALADSLQDLTFEGAACILRLRRAGAAQSELGEEWATLLEILQDAAMYWKTRGKTFIALVDDGAELRAWR